MDYSNLKFELGDQRLIGQRNAREHLKRILRSNRIGHAYLFSGPPGAGKTAVALAFAELLNGVNNLTDLQGQAFSKKSSWFTHPDIHLFLPVPTTLSVENLRERLELLKKDPYEIIDFSVRPSISDDESSKNKQAFYPIDYFREEIKPAAYLKPNEGEKTVIIITNIEHIRTEAANAFLKLLEEPADDIVFLLTTDSLKSLLPTIISRCQHVQLRPLHAQEIEEALITYDNLPADEARYLARVSGGNYSMTRFFDAESLKATRRQVIEYLRYAFVQDAVELTNIAKMWQKDYNIEGQIALLNILETFLRDLLIYRDTGQKDMITNVDRLEVIQKFCEALGSARLPDMIEQVNTCRPLLRQNVQAKLIFTALALRFSNLMRDINPAITEQESWKHLPAFTDNL